MTFWPIRVIARPLAKLPLDMIRGEKAGRNAISVLWSLAVLLACLVAAGLLWRLF